MSASPQSLAMRAKIGLIYACYRPAELGRLCSASTAVKRYDLSPEMRALVAVVDQYLMTPRQHGDRLRWAVDVVGHGRAADKAALVSGRVSVPFSPVRSASGALSPAVAASEPAAGDLFAWGGR